MDGSDSSVPHFQPLRVLDPTFCSHYALGQPQSEVPHSSNVSTILHHAGNSKMSACVERRPRLRGLRACLGDTALTLFALTAYDCGEHVIYCSALYSTTGQLSHPARNRAHRSHVYHGYTWTPLSPYRTSPVDTCNPVAACKGLYGLLLGPVGATPVLVQLF